MMIPDSLKPFIRRGLFYRFSTPALAFESADRIQNGAGMVIMGDDGRFWVVMMADAERLHRAGYAYAER